MSRVQPNPKALYVVKKPKRKNSKQLALHVHMKDATESKKKELHFFDTIHSHMLIGELKYVFDDGFIFEVQEGTKNDGNWHFKEVTLTFFRDEIADYVLNGDIVKKVVDSTADLWEWYRKNTRENKQ